MSIRVRLILLILAMVVAVSATLSALQIRGVSDTWSADALERAELTAQQVKNMLVDNIERQIAGSPAPTDLNALKRLYTDTVAKSVPIREALTAAIAPMKVVVDVHIVGQDKMILTSSLPSRIGTPVSNLPSFEEWRKLSWWRRLVEIYQSRRDYQVSVPLGLAGSSTPLFTIQVVVSAALLRAEIMDLLGTLTQVTVFALLLALGLGLVAANIALHPLTKISERLDQMATGDYQAAAEAPTTRELALVESKLNLLGLRDAEARKALASRFEMPTRLSAISRLTGGVAHEIKNPLNAIALRLELLRAKTTEDHPELSDDFSILSREVTRLDRVVKTFLDFTRPVEVTFTDIDLAAVASDILKLIAPQAKAQNVEIEFIPPASPARIKGDADLLRQALMNLVTNGIEAMKAGGKLKVSVERQGANCILTIADEGPGIPEELRHKVFQLYFTTKERGSGIGLAMTFRAVQLHNGTIDFSSQKEKGTEFRLQFPALT